MQASTHTGQVASAVHIRPYYSEVDKLCPGTTRRLVGCYFVLPSAMPMLDGLDKPKGAHEAPSTSRIRGTRTQLRIKVSDRFK